MYVPGGLFYLATLWLVPEVPPYMSRVVRKPAFCICENKDADQLRGNLEADQRLCFRYMDSTIPLLSKSEIQASSHRLWLHSPVCVGPGRIPRRPVFTQRGSNYISAFSGDRVTVEPLTPCWQCDICKGGRYNLCKSRKICSIWPHHGMFQRYHVHAAELCFKWVFSTADSILKGV